jgi:hypothetical protein
MVIYLSTFVASLFRQATRLLVRSPIFYGGLRCANPPYGADSWQQTGWVSAYLVLFMRYHKRVYRSSIASGSQCMQAILLSREEVARRAKQLYESSIRQKVETEENIGKMVIIDIETGDYEVDKTGLQASRNLSKKHPNARLFGIRIGYNVAVSFGGVMERVQK